MGEAKRKREALERKKSEIRAAFPVGTWVFGIGPHIGCSPVFEGNSGHYQPFSYLGDYDVNHFRVATPDEVMAAMAKTQQYRQGALQQ